MTRTGKSPRLCAHSPEPCLEIHPADAARASLRDGGFAKVTTRHGSAVFKVAVSEKQRRGSIFAPIHWSDATAGHAHAGALAMADNDPWSGQPELKATPARADPVEFAYRGFALARRPITLPAEAWFARVAVTGGEGVLFASNTPPDDWHDLAPAVMPADTELAEYVDRPRGIVRMAAFRGDRLEGCLFIGPAHNPPHWDMVRPLFEAETVTPQARRLLLSGRNADGIAETGPIVCVCFGVGRTTIRDAVTTGGAKSVADIGRLLRAGTNCGSCVPELRGILENEMEKI